MSRVPFMPRERAAYIILRRKQVSINEMAKAFGRSTSVIHRTLSVASQQRDLRKLPARTRVLGSLRNHKVMEKLKPLWEAFILGIGEKPP